MQINSDQEFNELHALDVVDEGWGVSDEPKDDAGQSYPADSSAREEDDSDKCEVWSRRWKPIVSVWRAPRCFSQSYGQRVQLLCSWLTVQQIRIYTYIYI